jgi:outer membrane protein assembly factor BamB
MKNYIFQLILIINLLIIASCSKNHSAKEAKTWPQFRGINCSGLAAEDARPPIEFSDKTLLWKIVLPAGHSSPVVWDDKIFLTAFIKDSSELQTICIKRKNGKTIWKQSILPEKIEGYHSISNAAMASPVTDGEHVYVYFGSYGILCYNFNGGLVWEYKINVHPYRWGVSSSPIIYKDYLILSRDISKERQVIALNKRTGEIIWKIELPNVNNTWTTNWTTPVIYKDQIILHRAGEIASYSVNDGHRIWWLPYLTSGTSTPVINNNMIYIGTWHNFSENELRANFQQYFDFYKLVKDFDLNQDGFIQKEEIPDTLLIYTRPGIEDLEGASNTVKQNFGTFDKNKNGAIDKFEWEETVKWTTSSFYKEAGLIALNPSEEGELTMNNIVWREPEKVPEVPSPMIYRNLIYMCKEGGILTCMDAEKGTILYRERIGASGPYFASPVAANGYIYFASGKGVITVIKAGNKLNIAKQSNLKEDIFASPLIIDNAFYVRTVGHLYAFK